MTPAKVNPTIPKSDAPKMRMNFRIRQEIPTEKLGELKEAMAVTETIANEAPETNRD